ncbi:hypothetical protein U370_03020 [Anaplasma marginale str. Dawn]|uniref:DUF2460 domain-containing protein n=1 Tax=Anaplasma marginale TaxID=770 RepID=UPI0003C2B30F|nr:DUF2460 domain-containing protein [Anaplasma marginale]AGZ78959.1 hypothetical protein U128_03125 [Anaplasma marginale str. Gypsy Plains]AGZ79779.1 hypothetical protein U370_03020 [Anaplasma marginale str. Dawn]AXW84165.1 TIGR02217 family protein [Anaplasma marginale]AXW85085.1 TIGR02217 family protein [Anaplasma marginale]KAB0452988.1 TIGR02217 family protein [Anaplasma marginale]
MESYVPNNEAKFPENISYGSMGGPTFSTVISELGGGKEQRKVNWTHSRNRYNVAYNTASSDQCSALISFFYAHRGKALPFRFKDWSDYTATGQNIGVGDGKRLNFQLVKRYHAGQYSYVRKISRPVVGTVKVSLGEVSQEYERDYSVDYNSGVVTFAVPPAHDAIIHADFEFDVLVRFDTDFLAFALEAHGNYGCHGVSLVEVSE